MLKSFENYKNEHLEEYAQEIKDLSDTEIAGKLYDITNELNPNTLKGVSKDFFVQSLFDTNADITNLYQGARGIQDDKDKIEVYSVDDGLIGVKRNIQNFDKYVQSYSDELKSNPNTHSGVIVFEDVDKAQEFFGNIAFADKDLVCDMYKNYVIFGNAKTISDNPSINDVETLRSEVSNIKSHLVEQDAKFIAGDTYDVISFDKKGNISKNDFVISATPLDTIQDRGNVTRIGSFDSIKEAISMAPIIGISNKVYDNLKVTSNPDLLPSRETFNKDFAKNYTLDDAAKFLKITNANLNFYDKNSKETLKNVEKVKSHNDDLDR